MAPKKENTSKRKEIEGPTTSKLIPMYIGIDLIIGTL
jgi:hypothetical protein